MLRVGAGLLQAKSSIETRKRTKMRRHILIGAALALAGAAIGAPLPPRRPLEFSPPMIPQTAPASPAAPRPSTEPKPSSAPLAPDGRAPVDVDVNTLQPFNLPPASRQQMRQCGEEWRALKMAGKSSGMVWRGFAEKCLSR